MWSEKPSFRFEVDKFSEKEDVLTSQIFVSGGCQWLLKVYPKGNSLSDDYMSLYLIASNPRSAQTGWKRKARFYFSVLNHSDRQILYVSPIASEKNVFCAKARSWGFRTALALSKLSKIKEEGLSENDRIFIEVYINNVEVDDGEKKETLDFSGIQAFATHVNSVMKKTFSEHIVKKDYKNALSNACNKVSGLAEEGFKMDWLKSKIDEISSKMKKSDDADRSQIHQLEERIKKLEVMGLLLDSKIDCSTLKSKLEDVSKKSHVQQLEERIKNLELSMERREANDADGSKVQQLEERIKNLELVESGARLDNLESELEDASSERLQEIEERLDNLETDESSKLWLQEIDERLENLEERKESDEDYEERLQEIDERLENLEKLVSDLRDELDP